jgi:acetylornithine deacetylase/succinyl-diaminopimelate desuccinylase-like protein
MPSQLRHSPTVERALIYAGRNRARFVRELQRFVGFASVSAQPQHAADLGRCAEWLAQQLQAIGMERVHVAPTPRHPIVYAEWRRAPGRPTVLIYGHYDVQPADPRSAWRDPPFAATVRGATLYGRGASDDKGQLWAHIKALEAYLRTTDGLPLNVVCVFEGEEEIGSPNLLPFLRSQPAVRAADLALMSDTRFRARGRPAIIYALRGSLALDVELHGPAHDLHSGSFGGAIHNPLQALAELIACLHDRDGRITIPSFYDQVRPVSADERAYLAQAGPSDAEILRDARSAASWGERGYSLYERATIRPALTINGISGGYSGPGGKSIIPARALAKLSVRLVPDQQPAEIARLFGRHWALITPAGLRSVVRVHSGASPALIDPRHWAIRAAAAAYRRGFGAAPVLLRSGGTIPIVNAFETLLHIPTVLMGFALPDDRMHAPNEKFELPQLYGGIATAIAFLDEVGARAAGRGARPPALALELKGPL